MRACMRARLTVYLFESRFIGSTFTLSGRNIFLACCGVQLLRGREGLGEGCRGKEIIADPAGGMYVTGQYLVGMTGVKSTVPAKYNLY